MANNWARITKETLQNKQQEKERVRGGKEKKMDQCFWYITGAVNDNLVSFSIEQ